MWNPTTCARPESKTATAEFHFDAVGASGHFNGACALWVEIQTDTSGLQHFDHPVLVLEDNTTLCYFAYILSQHAGFRSRRNTDHEQMARVHWEIGSDNPKPYLASWNLTR